MELVFYQGARHRHNTTDTIISKIVDENGRSIGAPNEISNLNTCLYNIE